MFDPMDKHDAGHTRGPPDHVRRAVIGGPPPLLVEAPRNRSFRLPCTATSTACTRLSCITSSAISPATVSIKLRAGPAMTAAARSAARRSRRCQPVVAGRGIGEADQTVMSTRNPGRRRAHGRTPRGGRERSGRATRFGSHQISAVPPRVRIAAGTASPSPHIRLPPPPRWPGRPGSPTAPAVAAAGAPAIKDPTSCAPGDNTG